MAVGSRYIYRQRKAGSSEGRTAENNLEIEEMFRSAGSAVVDPASMTFNRQKAIFQNAEIIAGSTVRLLQMYFLVTTSHSLSAR